MSKRIKLKDLLKESISGTIPGSLSTRGGFVSNQAFSTSPNMGSQKHFLKQSISENEDSVKMSPKDFQKAVSNFNSIGRSIHREDNLSNIANTLSELAENAKNYALEETDQWFDKITVNRNMRELTSLANSFKKVANESDVLQQRMSTLYEDMGNILGRYYEINDSITEEEKDKYEKFFRASLKKFGVKSPAELDKDKKKDFFNYVDKNYDAKIERD